MIEIQYYFLLQLHSTLHPLRWISFVMARRSWQLSRQSGVCGMKCDGEDVMVVSVSI